MESRPSRRRRLVERIRHARHPLQGWRRWLVITGQAVVGIVALFAVLNLALSLSTFRGEQPVERTIKELQILWFSPADGQRVSPDAFRAVHGRDLGSAPASAEIRNFLKREAADGVFLLDQVLIDRILALNGRVDARAVPVGVYVGAHALGPDGLPFVPATKFLAHYLLFPRHAYVLVVPEEGPALAFSASQNAKFKIRENPDRLTAVIAPYDPQAYDFPGSGQAIHEMTLVTDEPASVAGALDLLRRTQADLAARDLRYGLLAPNSNTVIGCLLDGAGAISPERRSSILLALRAPGFGARCD